MKLTTNKTILDLRKVQHGTLWWVNQHGEHLSYCPGYTTWHCKEISDVEKALFHPDYPDESMLKRAKRLGYTDVWKLVVYFQLTANHRITYTDDKASDMWKAWNAYVFAKNKRKAKKK